MSLIDSGENGTEYLNLSFTIISLMNPEEKKLSRSWRSVVPSLNWEKSDWRPGIYSSLSAKISIYGLQKLSYLELNNNKYSILKDFLYFFLLSIASHYFPLNFETPPPSRRVVHVQGLIQK